MDLSEINKLLSQSNILISDKENVKNKIKTLHEGTPSKLQIVADFDFTLTHCFDNDGQKLLSSFGAVEFDSRFSDDFRSQLVELYHRYSPIDADPNIEQSEKIRLVEEWNRRATEVYKSEHITSKIIGDAVAVARVKLRAGFNQLITKTSNVGIPFLILSAGLGDSIDHVIVNNGIPSDSIKTISNYFIFDDKGFVNGLTKPLITTGSKGKRARDLNTEYFESVQERKNIILLGDRIEDLQMGDCFDTSCNDILTIGFLNEKVDEQRDLYMKNYDVVLLDDPDLSWIQTLIDIVL